MNITERCYICIMVSSAAVPESRLRWEKKCLILMRLYAGVVSAPLWNSEKSTFAGMLTVSDIIHLIQYYYHTATYEKAAEDVENLRLEDLRRASTPFILFRSLDLETNSQFGPFV